MSVTYDQIKTRLEEIERDLAERMPEYEQAAETKHRLVRQYELRMARAMIAAAGKTATEKKAQALLALAVADDGLYAALMDAEGTYEGRKAAVRVLETRATIGMSLLKAEQREVGA